MTEQSSTPESDANSDPQPPFDHLPKRFKNMSYDRLSPEMQEKVDQNVSVVLQQSSETE